MTWFKRVLIAILLAGVIHAPAHAAEEIVTFQSHITVQESGRVDVAETIDYDFGTAQRHGIYRYIPVVYTDDQSQTYKPGFNFDSVTVDGQSANYSTSRQGDNEVIKIGDADATVTGLHNYTIKYHFDSLVVSKDGELLRFNVTGSDWNVPIASVTAQVTGPEGFKTVCYAGSLGANNQPCEISGMDSKTVVVRADNLGYGKDFTVEALWPASTFGSLLQPYVTPWWVRFLWLAAVVYVLAGVGLLVAAMARWLGIRHAEKQAQRDQTIIAQYEAPKDLTPGEIGLLTDNKTSLIEVTATLIQAAISGYIKIEQIAEKSLFKKAEYKLTKLKDFAGLDASEQTLLTVLFDGKSNINMKDIDKTAVPAAVKKYQENLRQNLKDKGLYTKTSKFTGAAVAGAVVGLLFLSFSPFVVISIVGIVPIALYLYKRAGQIPRRTPEGLASWAYVEGFKLFLSVTEKDRLAFTDAPKRTPAQFSKLLPYAIALGVEKQWAAQFEGIDISQSMGWYGGNTHAFTAGYLVGSLSDSFASTVAASTAPTTSSSGFGGGSSGGGFGGGGGGSW